jgi:hypothetical protein
MDCSNRKKKALFSFHEARRIARYHGFESKEEFLEYSCPGAYQLPKNPHEVWCDEWRGWENFLGICWNFQQGRAIARALNIRSKQEYLMLFEEKRIDDDDPASLLPYRPDLNYKADWLGWKDWLSPRKRPSPTTLPEAISKRIIYKPSSTSPSLIQIP